MTEGRILWKVGDVIPSPLRGTTTFSKSKWLRSIVVPRPVAWVSVDDETVAILDGYTAACYTPPTLFFAQSSLPIKFIEKLKDTGICTLSVATFHDPKSALELVSSDNIHDQKTYTFQELNLSRAQKRNNYPCAIESSPVHMYCKVSDRVSFHESSHNDADDVMLILIAETVVFHKSILSDPTNSMKQRSISAKIDAALIQPVVSLGSHHPRFHSLKEIRSMPRPKLEPSPHQDDATTGISSSLLWVSSDFHTVVPTGPRSLDHTTTEWNYRIDGHSCALGFNPTLAFIMPRPIGWISTYSKEGRVPHLAPYSFFIDVGYDVFHPMVAFSAYRPIDGTRQKDAQKDTEEMGCFCFNLCTEELAVAVNLSAAEMKRDESEFTLTGLIAEPATTIDAPYIHNAPIHLECTYEKTYDVGNFSIVIGRVQAVAIESTVLNDNGEIDTSMINFIARLGYTDEYGIIS
jgi:flavin reductase (DIM6/NTAB) family NADH-FMN oxidoreductase RutF